MTTKTTSPTIPAADRAAPGSAGEPQQGAIGLEQNAFGRLVLVRADGERVEDVTPVRCFPFSDPDHWVSFVDAQGHEVHLQRELATLPEAVREQVRRALAEREFIPTIRRIVSVVPDSEPSVWKVETDRGEVEFTLTSEDHVRRLESNGVLLADSHGIRYRILNRRALDGASRKILARYL